MTVAAIPRQRLTYCKRGHDRTVPGAVNRDRNCVECKRYTNAVYYNTYGLHTARAAVVAQLELLTAGLPPLDRLQAALTFWEAAQ